MPSFAPHEVAGAAARAAAQELLLGVEDDDEGSSRHALAFEVLAASLALGGSRAPPVNQARYSFRGQAAVADCAELCARELLNALLWDATTLSFDAGRLPLTAHDALRAFYSADGPANREAAARSCEAAATAAAGPAEERWHAGAPVYTQAAKVWFDMVSGLPGVHYLSGIPSARYELAPTCDAVVHCLGVLLGQASSVRTPASLEGFWRELHPSRGLQLSVNESGDRMRLLEPSAEAGGELECSLELVMAMRLNHAFAVHHWRAPSWQAEAAALALQSTTSWPPTTQPATTTMALMPALLQPLLASPATPDPKSASAPLLRRLMLSSADFNDDHAIGHGVLRLLQHFGDQGDAELAARVLAATKGGLAKADDALLLRVAALCARCGPDRDVLRRAALLHPPLSAATAVMSGAANALPALVQAIRASPMRSASIAAQAALAS